MKKTSNFSFIVYLLMVVAAYFIGKNIIMQANKNVSNSIALVLIGVALGLIVNAVLMEVGHVIGAKIGGYQILSFHVLGFGFIKTQNKWRFCFSNFDGLTGETQVIAKKENAKPQFMFWGGTLLLLIEIACFVLIPLFVPNLANKIPYIVYGGFLIAMIGGGILIYNILPFRLDTKNDGVMMRMVNKEFVPIYNELTKMKGALYDGKPLENIQEVEKINMVSGYVNYYAYLEKIYERDYEQAGKIIDYLMEHSEALNDATYHQLIAGKMYVLMQTETKEKVEEYYNALSQHLKKELITPDTIEAARAYFAYAIMMDSYQDAKLSWKKWQLLKKRCKEVGRIEQEELFMQELTEVLKEKHPDWNLESKEE